ncbi:MAG: type II toxin-antitoxin system RelE/ParE family toxin [Planctomycetota bacterium]|nr:type II toxin-antitoxin system RelE/ParE family toxin [Planctomycetota bacterium]
MNCIFHPDAEAELIEAARFYEQRLPGLGAEFLNEMDSAVASILEAPKRWRMVEKDIRRFPMRRFPYAIYYRIHGEVLRILVVKHHSRHPDYWKYRMKDDA